MKINFLINDYNLIWNVLFQASITERVHALKQKLWNNYKEEYLETYNEKNSIFSDYKNYIPNNDLIQRQRIVYFYGNSPVTLIVRRQAVSVTLFETVLKKVSAHPQARREIDHSVSKFIVSPSKTI